MGGLPATQPKVSTAGRSKGVAFVDFRDETTSNQAMEGKLLKSCSVVIGYSSDVSAIVPEFPSPRILVYASRPTMSGRLMTLREKTLNTARSRKFSHCDSILWFRALDDHQVSPQL